MVAFTLRVVKLETLPLSLSLDEATNGLDAWQLSHPFRLTPFLQNNFGRETLFFYLQALAFQLYGVSIFSLRFTAALAGTLTLPLIYVVGRRLFPGSLIGLWAATGLTVSYWHIYFSRVGLRAIILLPLWLLIVWCWWRGWFAADQRKSGLWLTLAGGLLGLSCYSYLAARLLPIILAVFIIIAFCRRPNQWPIHRRHTLRLSLPAFFIALPLINYFWHHPLALSSRAQAISLLTVDQPGAMLAQNGLNLLQLHFFAGRWLGQWPALDPLTALGFGVGLLICLRRLRQPAYYGLLIWWSVGLLPVLLSVQNWPGETTILRGIIAWPAMWLITGLGWQHLISLRGSSELSRRYRRYIPVGYLLLAGMMTSNNYFQVWATTYNDFSDHPPSVARYANRQTSQLTLLPLTFYAETVGHLLLKAQYPHLENLDQPAPLLTADRPARYLLPYNATTESAFVLLDPIRHTAYLLPPLSPAAQTALAKHSQSQPPLTTLLDGEQEPIGHLYPLPPTAPFLPTASLETPETNEPLPTDFAGYFRLLNGRVDPRRLLPGETVTLQLNWQAQRPIDGNYDLFIHLFDVGSRQRWGQINTPLSGMLFEAYHWPVGLEVPGVYHFQVPPDAPTGAYRFEVGLYQPATQTRLPVNGDDKLILGKFWLGEPPPPPMYPLHQVQFGDQIALVGYDLHTSVDDLTVEFTLHWRALRPLTQSYTVFNHLLDEAGQLQAQLDSPPQQGHYPTDWWSAGEIILDSYSLPLPPELPTGSYTLRVGLYNPQTGTRLPRPGEAPDYVDLLQ